MPAKIPNKHKLQCNKSVCFQIQTTLKLKIIKTRNININVRDDEFDKWEMNWGGVTDKT